MGRVGLGCRERPGVEAAGNAVGLQHAQTSPLGDPQAVDLVERSRRPVRGALATEQSAVTGPVVNTIPLRLPPQVLVIGPIWYPEAGANTKLTVVPTATLCGVAGLMVPSLADGVTTAV